MRLLSKLETKETKSRRKRFFAFILSVLICCMPTATIFAGNIYIEHGDQHEDFTKYIGSTINSGEYIYGSGLVDANNRITYKSSKGSFETEFDTSAYLNQGTPYDVKPINGFTKWKVVKSDYDDRVNFFTLEAIEEAVKEEKSKEKHYDQTPTSWLNNPNELSAFYYKDGQIDMKAKFGKAEQGEACKEAFRGALPSMWKQAFTFSMSYNDKHTTDLKDGTLVLYIPPDFQKSGREYAVMAIDKYSLVHIYYDTDKLDNVFTAKLGFEGYAFALIYKD